MKKALIGAGCFWGIEEYFRKTQGVIETKVGYSGGHTINPSYEDICTGMTGHAEVVLVKFDEKIISYYEIINMDSISEFIRYPRHHAPPNCFCRLDWPFSNNVKSFAYWST